MAMDASIKVLEQAKSLSKQAVTLKKLVRLRDRTAKKLEKLNEQITDASNGKVTARKGKGKK